MSRSKEITGIQYLRGLAALGVVIDHVSGMAAFPKYFGREVLGGFLRTGMLGVSLFFVISGFIICVIALRGPALRPTLSWQSFAEKRLIRIMPLMWTAILSYAALRYLGRDELFHAVSYIRALLLFPVGPVEPNQIWTLRHEALFYAVFALSFLTFARLRWLLLLWFLAPVCYIAVHLPAQPTSPGRELLRLVANPVNLEFCAGFALGLLYLRKPYPRSLVIPAPYLFLVLAALSFMALGYVASITLQDFRSCLLSSLICAPIIYASIHLACPPGALDRFGRLLGDASFAIYLFHLHIASALLGAWASLFPATPVWLVIAGTAVAATAFGVGIHLALERPLLKFSRRIVDRFFPVAVTEVRAEEW